MKKFLVLAALALMTVGFATQAVAMPSAGPHLVFNGVNFRTQATAGTLLGLGGVPCVDSIYNSGIAKFDTTGPISTSGWTRPNASASIDSSVVFTLHVWDAGLASLTAGKTSATAESIYVKLQGSVNGVSWTDLPVLTGHAPVLNAWTVQTTVNAAVTTFTNSSNTGLSDKLWSLSFGTAAHHNGDLAIRYPYIRFILSGSRTLNHSWRAGVTYWSSLGEQ